MITRLVMAVLALVPLALVWVPGAHAGSASSIVPDVDRARQREIQTRKFEARDENQLLRTVMFAMQDLEFVIDDAEPALGIIMGTKIEGQYRVRLSVFVRPAERGSFTIRASAHGNHILIEDPRIYQYFFDTLGIVMALP